MDEYEAANQWLQKRLNLPTEKTSFEISRDFEARQRAHAFFSARVAEGHILERLRGISDAYSHGEIGLAEARTRLKKFLRGEGKDDGTNGLRNLASTARLNLILEQNARMALSVADRAYVLETGAVALSGTGKELMASDLVRRAYLGG